MASQALSHIRICDFSGQLAGAGATRFLAAFGAQVIRIEDPVKKEQVESHIPMARAGTADEMGGVACFLASDDAAYITGQTIFVDGGLTLFPSFREPWSSE